MDVLTLATVRIDLERRWVERADGARESLTTLEAELLRYLAANSERTVSRDELLTEVWGHGPSVVSRACDNAIRRLRLKIEADPSEPEWLLTMHGAGYRLILGRSEPEPPSPPPAPPSTRRIPLGDRILDLDRARIEAEGEVISLTGNEIAVLAMLVEAGGAPVDRERMLRKIWGSTAGRPLDHTVSRLRKKLEPEPSRPRLLLRTAHGYRLELGEPPSEASPPPEGPLVALPAEVDRRVGREEEVSAIGALVGEGAVLVTLTGPGGVGKSRLALAAARELVETRGGGAQWFDLTEARTLDGMYAAMASALQLQLAADDPVARIGHALRGRGPLVAVLDNLEQLADASIPIGRWIELAPEARFLCTSRILLRLRGERRIEVLPLSVDQGAALFVERAIRPPPPSDRPEVEALVQDLEGLPLAIELAAARTRVLSVGEMRRRMRHRLQLLATGDRDRPERYQSLRASLDASWELLTPWARSALAQLTVFRGGFTLEACERVLALDRWPEARWTLDVLQELVDASLLRLLEGGERYGMLRAVEDHAAEHLSAEERDGAERRHGEHFAAFGGSRVEALDRAEEIDARRELSADLDNLLVAARRASDRGDGRIAAATATAAWEVLELIGPFRAGVELLERILWAKGLDARARAQVALAAGRARAAAADHAEALDHLAAAIGLAREARDPALGARALAERASVHRLRGERAEALEAAISAEAQGDPPTVCRALMERALDCYEARAYAEGLAHLERARQIVGRLGACRLDGALHSHLGLLQDEIDAPELAASSFRIGLSRAREVGDHRLEAYCLGLSGIFHRRRGKLGDALVHYEAAVRLHRRTGDRRFEAEFLGGLARNYQDLGRWDDAERSVREALDAARDIGIRSLERALLGTLGQLQMLRGRLGEGEQSLLSALSLARLDGDLHAEAVLLTSLGNLARKDGRLDQALSWQLDALDLHRRVGRRWSEGVTLGHLAMVFDDAGRLGEAHDHYVAALEIHREVGNARFAAMVQQHLGRLQGRRGDPQGAAAHLAEAERAFREIGDPAMIARTLMTRAELLRDRGEVEAARALEAEARTLATDEQLGERRAFGRG